MRSRYDDSYKYIYFNHMNLALKTSLKHKANAIVSRVRSPALPAITTETYYAARS
jgi:hypothetical protein